MPPEPQSSTSRSMTKAATPWARTSTTACRSRQSEYRARFRLGLVPESHIDTYSAAPSNWESAMRKFDEGAAMQVAMVVRDMDQAMKRHWDVFNIGPWDIYEFNASKVENYVYRGK